MTNSTAATTIHMAFPSASANVIRIPGPEAVPLDELVRSERAFKAILEGGRLGRRRKMAFRDSVAHAIGFCEGWQRRALREGKGAEA